MRIKCLVQTKQSSFSELRVTLIYCKMLYLHQVKIQGQNEEMLSTACEQFLGKNEDEIHNIALVTLEGHQRAIMGSMTVEVS